MANRPTTILLGLSATILAACGGDPASSDNANMTAKAPPVLGTLDEATYVRHLTTLASDEFEGRAPATKGGRMTREYLIAEMQRIGLEPGNGDSFEQPVGLVEQTLIPQQSRFELTTGENEVFTFDSGDGATPAQTGDDVVYWSKRIAEDITVEDSELVFVGFGVVAPEFGWDDYAGLDVTGKTVVMLVNDPGFYLQGEEFRGRAMTYYGRWTYKYEEAARQGAAAAIVIHETEPAAYGWGVVEGSWSGPQLDLERPDGGASRTALEGWVRQELAEAMFAHAGTTYDAARDMALSGAFKAMPMGGLTLNATLKNAINRNNSANVAGVIKGQVAPEDYVLYVAHWDHLGKTFAAIGGGDGSDTINNGAVDNATGTAALLSMAESFATADRAPDRSVMFLAVTAEESGLLGSAYFGEDPLVPLEHIVGGLNMDAVTPSGPAKDLIVVGYGASELEDILKNVADKYGKYLRPDAQPEKGFFYRSDHVSLAKKGVPMLYVDKGIDLVDGGEEAGRAIEADYTANKYHKPADEIDDTWTYEGLLETFTILRDVGADLAYSDKMPNWYEGNEFRALRDEQLSRR